MAQVRLTKSGRISLLVFLVIFSFGVGFGVWKITGLNNLAPTDSDAAGAGWSCIGPCLPVTQREFCGYGGNSTEDACEASNGTRTSLRLCNTTVGEFCGAGNSTEECWCCNGSNYLIESGAGAGARCRDLCRGNGGQGDPHKGECEADVARPCNCESFAGCGVNCTFPAGTQQEVNNEVAGSCSRVMAFCEVTEGGGTRVVIKDAGSCWAQRHVCKNPHAEENCDEPPPPPPTTNVCEGGGVTSPTNRVTTTIGESVNFCGYAYDADGIDVDNIQITLDGTVVGNATVTDACADPNDPICLQYAGKNPVKWCYTFVSTTEGDSVIRAVWKDTKGVTGNSCQGEREITTAVVQDDWIADKSAARICINENTPNVAVRLNYTITITNSADATKQINRIVDTLDSKVQSSYIELESIVPNASVSGNVITWDLTGAAGVFAPGETKSFRYSLVIPQGAFGTYHNVAVISPMDAESDIEVDETIIASCDVPDTALFDSVGSKIAVGVFLILVALVYAYIDPLGTRTGKLAYNLSKDVRQKKTREKMIGKSRESFEKRVVG